MKYILLILALLISYGTQAETLTSRYPDYNHSETGACNDAKLYIKNRAYSECSDGVAGSIATSCVNCTKKIRFNTPTWTCTGKADFTCKGAQAETSTINDMRGKLRQNTRGNNLGGPCLQFPNSEKCRKWKQQYQKAVGGVRN